MTSQHSSDTSSPLRFFNVHELAQMLLDERTQLELAEAFEGEPTALWTLRHFHFISDTIERLEHVIEQHRREQLSVFDYLADSLHFQDTIHPVIHEHRRRQLPTPPVLSPISTPSDPESHDPPSETPNSSPTDSESTLLHWDHQQTRLSFPPTTTKQQSHHRLVAKTALEQDTTRQLVSLPDHHCARIVGTMDTTPRDVKTTMSAHSVNNRVTNFHHNAVTLHLLAKIFHHTTHKNILQHSGLRT